jgi:serine O-acetyltransferase
VFVFWPLVASRLEFIEPGQLSMFKNIRGDFLAHGSRWGAQGFWAMVVYRFGRWRYGVRPQVLRKCLSLVYWVLYKIVQVVTGIELPCEVEVGHNFTIDHFGGIIISGYAKFGDNYVDIGSGAKLLGPIRVGDNVLIGANAVVLLDVPNDSVAVGVPAVVKPRRSVLSPMRVIDP